MPRVAVLTGSQSDLPVLEPCLQALSALGIEHELHVMSAHRDPAQVQEFASTAAERGFEVIIAAAGMAAHLPGVVAAWTSLPVIGVPVGKPGMSGLDALLSIAQMPRGVPVATVAIGVWGAANAGILAAQILAAGDPALAKRLAVYRQRLTEEVDERARRVAERLAPGAPPSST